METLLGILIIFFIVYLLFKYIVVPIFLSLASFLFSFILVMATIYAFIVSSKAFFPIVYKHRNPYNDPTSPYVDRHKDAVKGVRRGYFFGPGIHQLKTIVTESFVELESSHKDITNWWENLMKTGHPVFVKSLATIFYFLSFVLIFVLGGLWVAIFSVIISAMLFAGMMTFFLSFSLLWSADRIYLIRHAIQSRCPECHKAAVVPAFLCNQCGVQHNKLIPGPYGIFRRTCSCGNSLPTTIFSGRSELEALCPRDFTPLATSKSKQIGIQMVGCTKSGKTTFLASFWHCFNERVRSYSAIQTKYSPETMFNLLEETFLSGDTFDATKTFNAAMYSVILEMQGTIPLQFSIYDIAGEAFESLETNQQQEQFGYCEGIVFLVDPVDDFSMVYSCISSFITNFESLKGIHSSKVVSLPVALLITKADLYRKQIGPIKMKIEYNKIKDSYPEGVSVPDYRDARNAICRNFLLERGFAPIIQLLEAKFQVIEYYSVSAIGHEPNMQTYEPWGVIEPIRDIMNKSTKWSTSGFGFILKGEE